MNIMINCALAISISIVAAQNESQCEQLTRCRLWGGPLIGAGPGPLLCHLYFETAASLLA